MVQAFGTCKDQTGTSKAPRRYTSSDSNLVISKYTRHVDGFQDTKDPVYKSAHDITSN